MSGDAREPILNRVAVRRKRWRFAAGVLLIVALALIAVRIGPLASSRGVTPVGLSQVPAGDSTCRAYPKFPDAACTGPRGKLREYHNPGGNPNLEFRTDGQVIENVVIRARTLYVPANNVVFRNVRIIYTGSANEDPMLVNLNYNHGTVFDHCELDGANKVARAIAGSGVTVLNSNIHNTGNAIETDPPIVAEDNYIHDIFTPKGLGWHADGIQAPLGSDDISIVHNTIILTGPETGAVDIMGTPGNHSDNVLVEHNLLGGGSYTVYAGFGPSYRVIDNHFTTSIYPLVGRYNIWYFDPGQDGGLIRRGNVIDGTGAPADQNLPSG